MTACQRVCGRYRNFGWNLSSHRLTSMLYSLGVKAARNQAHSEIRELHTSGQHTDFFMRELQTPTDRLIDSIARGNLRKNFRYLTSSLYSVY